MEMKGTDIDPQITYPRPTMIRYARLGYIPESTVAINNRVNCGNSGSVKS
jgi:hypothetical protein